LSDRNQFFFNFSVPVGLLPALLSPSEAGRYIFKAVKAGEIFQKFKRRAVVFRSLLFFLFFGPQRGSASDSAAFCAFGGGRGARARDTQ